MSYIVSVSAVVATTSVLLVFQLGQPRIWMSMSRDGLLPPAFGRIHPKFQTPYFSTIVTGIIVAVPALFVQSALMTDLTSIGTLFAFVLVAAGVLALPKDNSGAPRSFKLPYINGKVIVPVLVILFFTLFSQRIINAFEYKIMGKKVERKELLGGSYTEAIVSTTTKDTSYSKHGLSITSLQERSTLAKLGLAQNDVLTMVNDSVITTTDQLQTAVDGLKETSDISVEYVSKGELKSNKLSKGMQEALFLVYILVAALMAILSFMRNYSLIPVLGVLSCAYLLIEIPAISWMWFFGWMALGLVIYFLYGYRKSKLANVS